MKYNKSILLSVATATVLLGGQVVAGDITQALPGAADAFIVEQPAGTELMRVHGDGNVGVGVSTPTNTLDVNGTTRVRDLAGYQNTDTIVSSSATGVLRNSGVTVQSLLDAIANLQTAVDSTDTDGDGIPNGTDPDDDNDGVDDTQEATDGTNPLIADTDGDGIDDGQEKTDGTDPLDPLDFIDPTPPLPGNIALTGGQVLFLASLADTDYIPYTAPTGPATLNTNQQADGTADPAVDTQGALDIIGKTVGIPYTVTANPVALPAFTQTINIPAHVTEDGISRDVTLSYPAQTLAVGTGVVLSNMKTTTGTLNAKKLDLQTGIGDGSDTILTNSNGSVTKSVLGYLMGTFTIALNSAGDTAEVQLRDIAGIPDRMMGQVDNSGNIDTHDFLYLPVTNPITGKTWLNNNLGAHYADMNHASFNIGQQAQSVDDHHAYGSLFQWGRKADGHELVNWTSGAVGYGKVAAVTGQSATSVPTVDHFLRVSSDWLSSPDNTLWAGEASTNNVCPIGYRLPLNPDGADNVNNEFYQEKLSWGGGNSHWAARTSTLALTVAGYRGTLNGVINSEGNSGYYWTGSLRGVHARKIYFHQYNVQMTSYDYRANGNAVRCIQD